MRRTASLHATTWIAISAAALFAACDGKNENHEESTVGGKPGTAYGGAGGATSTAATGGRTALVSSTSTVNVAGAPSFGGATATTLSTGGAAVAGSTSVAPPPP